MSVHTAAFWNRLHVNTHRKPLHPLAHACTPNLLATLLAHHRTSSHVELAFFRMLGLEFDAAEVPGLVSKCA